MPCNKKFEVDTSTPVLVTGATGYVASAVIQQLLQHGCSVHATVRDPANTERLDYLLNAAKNTKGGIKFFYGDLLEPGSFRKAMEGCSIVFHTASPVKFLTKVDPMKDLVEPAVKGTENVLTTACEVNSVERVILTSSVAAIWSDAIDTYYTPNHKLTEEHWNQNSSKTHKPYSYSKTLAEQKAWEIAGNQSKWKLVVLNPSIVLGPGLKCHESAESFQFLKSIATQYPHGAPAFSVGIVDIREVASAHLAAAFLSTAEGRHIISAHNVMYYDIAKILYKNFGGKHGYSSIPNGEGLPIPKLLLWLVGPWVNPSLSRNYIRDNYRLQLVLDNSKSVQELGMEYRPMEETVTEMFQQMINSGMMDS